MLERFAAMTSLRCASSLSCSSSKLVFQFGFQSRESFLDEKVFIIAAGTTTYFH
jgi:hypothetical protein